MADPIIIDNGSAFLKVGFASDSDPKSIIPTVVGKPIAAGFSQFFFGDEANAKRGMLSLTYPILNGMIEKWDDMEILWQYVFDKQLSTSAADHPVLLTERPLNSTENREKMTEVMFETFSTPALYIASHPILALKASGLESGVVLDVGDSSTYAGAIKDGTLQKQTVFRLELGGLHLTQYFAKELSILTSAEIEVVREVKESVCLVNPKGVESFEEKDYELPDGQILKVGEERYKCPEVLFNPILSGRVSAGIHELINNAVNKCDESLHKELFSNVVLAGGSSLFPGMAERVREELSAMTSEVTVSAPSNPHNSIWLGGKIVASQPNFSDMCISRAEYDESGASVVNTKCPV